MKDLSTVPYNPTSEKIVDILCDKIGNHDKTFFRVLEAYYLVKITSMMRVNIDTHDRGIIPINLYAINLGPSGLGKGYSSNIIEDQIIHKFRDRFLNDTFPALSEANLDLIAAKRSVSKGTTHDVELITTKGEFEALGKLAFSFNSATSAAVKQMRHKLLMSSAGSINLEIDEIGSNLLSNKEVLDVFFELYDVGKVKQKLTKNTSDNIRNEEIEGRTPTNMLLFGTPSKLLDGGKVEDETVSMLDAGMARRCFFGMTKEAKKDEGLTPEEIYDKTTNSASSTYLINLSDDLEKLADPANFNITLGMTKEVSLLLIEYRLYCEERGRQLSEHDTIRKAEIDHRYFKAVKLAGAYAFRDNAIEITEDHVYHAIRLAEDSGESLNKILTRDRNYVRLANYIADSKVPLTHADLIEDLPFYRKSEAQKREMMTLAIAHGYTNNIVIKRTFDNEIEFLSGESLQETDMNKVTISYSADIANGYENKEVPFDQLHKLTQLQGLHWVAHHVRNGHRAEEDIIQGFDLVVLDIDGTVNINTVKLLMEEYEYLIYTTKSHTDEKHRFRLILPMSHRLKFSKPEYTQFMRNVYEWVPFEVDTATVDRSRKWLTHDGHHEYNQGKQLNSLLFIPKTTKNNERKKFVADHQSLTNMERWFCMKTKIGNRSNQLIKYALMLVDAGLDFETVQNKVLSLNSKIPDSMTETEITSTILMTAMKAIGKRDADNSTP